MHALKISSMTYLTGFLITEVLTDEIGFLVRSLISTFLSHLNENIVPDCNCMANFGH